MRALPWLRALIPLVFIGLIETTIYHCLNVDKGPGTWMWPLYLIISTLGYISLFISIWTWKISPVERPLWARSALAWTFGAFTQKMVLIILLLVVALLGILLDQRSTVMLVMISMMISLVVFGALLAGSIWGKYRFEVEEVELSYDDLPKRFDGLKIVQISDAHSGTWDSIAGVRKGIEKIKQLRPDLILFSGDLVNTNKDEIDPFIDLFGELEAPLGKYAVLGNHDYYGQPRDRSKRAAYYADFFDKYRRMGFELLRNEHVYLKRDNGQIALIGVENWGSGRYFPKFGDLDVATKGLSRDRFSILMSHDPSHWELKALDHDFHFHLTLSGHTHAMQFGINLPFFKWSPVQYRYKYWMGLYQEKAQYLYVNRGFGMLAYPGRIGMYPEITLLTLRTTSRI